VRTPILPVGDVGSGQRPRARAWSPPVSRGRALVALAVVVHLTLCWVLRGFLTDDAWISVRYAENLADGAGPVWNPGGPRTEGFSNPLLVGIEALAHAVGLPAPAAARVVGVASGVACIVLVHAWGRRVVGEAAAGVGALLTACAAPFAAWAVGGLETLLVALVLTAGTLELARADGGRPWRAAVLFALLPWLRPEGLVVVLALVAASEGPGLLLRSTPWRRAARRLAWLAGLPVLSQAALELARWGLYGHLLPNSVLYKSGTSDELSFVLDKFLAQSAVVVVLALAGAAATGWRPRLLVVPFAVYAVGSLGTLDSANHFSRFFLPVWPQLALLAGVAVVTVAGAVSRLTAAVLLLATLAAALHVPPGSVVRVDEWQERYMTCRAGARAEVAAWLVESTPPSTTFSVSDAGLLPARAGGRSATDAFLLNDPLLQETGPLPPSARAEIVHERRPDVIVLASRDPERLVPLYPTERAVARAPQMADYRLAHVGSGGRGCGYHLLAYRR
jgi:arabinofuranosyltransferase